MGFAPNQQETQYAQSRAYGPAHWASLEPEAAMAALGSRRAGLNKAEVAERLARYGRNTLPRLRRRPWYFELVANFIHLFALLLWAGAGLAWAAGMPQLAWAIIAVIIINGLFSFWQEYQAERAAEALEALLPRQVMVRRDGQPQLVPTGEIAPGDLLLLSEGEATPADARLISAERLRLDVSSLTGESRPVPRTVESISASPDTGAATLSNLVFAGTAVASGRGEAVVFATGANTEFGRIAQLTQTQDERPSPLQRELKRVTRFVTILAVAMGIAFFVIGVKLGGLSPASGFLFAIGIIVANVPDRGEPMAGSGLVYATATTMTLAGIVACQVGNAFACRSSHQTSWRLGFASNHLLLIGIVVEISLLFLLVYSPPLQTVFGLAPLGIEHWSLLAAFGPLLLVCEEGRRAVWRRFSRAERRNPQRLSSQQPI